MPVPSTINDLSTTAGSNSPAGSESPALIDDYLRTHASFIKQVNDESVKLTGDQTVSGTKTLSTNPVLSGGTANGVLYLNGSKAVSSGSGLVFDGSNLGLGVTPSAWGGGVKSIQTVGASLWSSNSGNSIFTQNGYNDGTNTKYVTSNYASQYQQATGGHYWYTAPSGTAGNPITFTQAMTLDASGNLGVGTANPQYRAHVSSTDGGVDSWVGAQNATATTTIGAGFIAIAGPSSYYSTFKQRANGDAEIFHCNPTGSLLFATGTVERARIDSSGNLLVGTTSGSGHTINKAGSFVDNAQVLSCQGGGGADSFVIYATNRGMGNVANTAVRLGSSASTARSINASGTVNASGADYAEYENNNGLTISKGDVVGFKADGTLTLTYSEAVRFGIKSTDPSYVGGDTWGSEDIVGKRPVEPATDADQATKDQYAVDLTAFEARLEAERQKVDRIAYSGKVPVNVYGATPGGYVIAAEGVDGVIVGEFVADVDFAQYKRAVGRVNKLLPDGRCEVAVIIH